MSDFFEAIGVMTTIIIFLIGFFELGIFLISRYCNKSELYVAYFEYLKRKKKDQPHDE